MFTTMLTYPARGVLAKTSVDSRPHHDDSSIVVLCSLLHSLFSWCHNSLMSDALSNRPALYDMGTTSQFIQTRELLWE